MKILEKIKSNNKLIYIGILILGILMGWLIFGGSSSSESNTAVDTTEHEHKAGTKWTCSMHPQIKRDAPGSCPICGMELIPLEEDTDDGEADGNYEVKLTNTAMKIAEVSTSKIEFKTPYKEVYLPGKVMADERKISELTSRFSGRLEKLFVNFTGQEVRKGQVLAKIYSPELVTAQRELFEAIKFKETNPNYYTASRNKLRLWDLTDKQISDIEKSGEVEFYFDVLSPLTGTVTMRHVSLGDYVKEGSALFEIIDLRHIWVIFDAYENDIPWIKLKDNIKFTIKSIPNQVFESTVTFIDPVLNPKSRVAGIRAELDNPKGLLKPEMLASGKLKTMLSGTDGEILVLKSAILWTGKKAVVYVRTNSHQNMFQYREITLGAEAEDYYVVTDGLNKGELVATNGVFKIDAAAQLKGERSMMNPSGGKVSMGGHGNMDMGGGDDKKEKTPKMDMKEGAMNMSTMEVDAKFKEQIKAVFKNYLALKDAFVDTDANDAKLNAENVEASLAAVNMGLVKGEMHMKWMELLKVMKAEVSKIQKSMDIETQRTSLGPLSTSLYASIKYFRVDGINAYYQFCPMANDGNGANWLSVTEEIKNPFYGSAMLGCGETKEQLK